jgi:hypothetical protein
MEGPQFITQVLPFVTIILAVVFFLAFKLINRAKSKALGGQTGLSRADFRNDPDVISPDHDRRKITCAALVVESRGVLKASLQELTLSGAFLTCPNPRPIGCAIQVRILIDPQEALKFEAEVQWNNKNVAADKVIHRGMKIRFLQLSADDRKTLSAIVNAPRAEKLST